MGFPHDEYTPYGYLDTPTHTRNLTPRGVLRSHDAGFRWHYPAYAGSYGGRRETYRAGFRIALDGVLELPAFDNVVSPYHSKNLIAFDLRRGAAHGELTYYLVGEHVLCARLEAHDASRISVTVEYTRLLSANGEWGESGLVGRIRDGTLILQGFEDGEAFVLWASRPATDIGIAADAADAAAWAGTPAPGLPPTGFVTVTGDRGKTVALYGVLGFAVRLDEHLEVLLARGKTVDEAQQHLRAARATAEIEHVRKIAEDDAFWARAPRLEGAWPDHWRRGLVYDLETVRMMVKQPVGIYAHIWDAMQIQAPRVVLAESAFDALLLAYIDPESAQALMLGTFVDAPEPNVPCTREDGSYNMVAADGTACGTAPEWGYPWRVLDWLFALRPDHTWLERLYPRLVAHLDWWLAHRRDADGWLGYACSWESGQDDSPRFGDQPLGGGHPVRHVRPVDLHAAMTQAAGVMARFARTLGQTRDAAKWTEIAAEHEQRTDALWNDTRYADFDARAQRFTEIEDVMQLAPVALGVARSERINASRARIAAIDADTLTWPMFAWTAVGAASVARLPNTAAALAASVCERAYGFWDARDVQPHHTLPGISCEYWPLNGRCGGEGYGWGAFMVHLVIHTLVGFSPTVSHVTLCPNLPPAWREAGRHYTLHLHCRERPLCINLESLSAERVRVTLNGHVTDTTWGDVLTYPWEQV